MQFITTGNRIMTENFTVGLFYTITFLNENILACSCNGIGDNFVSFLCVDPQMQFILDLSTAETVDTIELYGGGAGTMNYNELNNKPSINGETLVGNLTTTDLHIRGVPAIDTTDNNKVLTASYVDGVTSYSWQTVATGTTNYNDLTNKPEINGHVLSGNQLPSQLGLVATGDLASYQPLIDSSHKLDPALIATDTNNRFATDTQLNQIETNKNNILLNLQANGAINNMIPTLVDKSTYGTYNTTAHTFAEETGHLDTTRNTLQWQVAVGSGTSLADAVQITQVVNKQITTPQTNAWEFTKTAAMTKIWFGHGAASGGVSTTFMFDISNLTNGTKYWIVTTFDNVTHADVDPQPYQWGNVMIVDDSIFAEVYQHITYAPYTMTNAEITAWILSQS